jgi:LysR family cys regulon transcriptional activator
VSIQQGSPEQIADMLIHDRADIAIATEGIAGIDGLLALPGYQWQHVIAVQPEHPLLSKKNVSLEDLAEYPIITYDKAFAGRSKIDRAFASKNLQPDVVLEAIDADVIKTYVETGMGIGIVAGVSYDADRDRNLRVIPAGHLFGNNVTKIAVKQNAYLRSFVYTFIELFSPSLTKKLIDQAMAGETVDYQI